MPIRSIPTKYKGVIFRSRLEATWASYFDFIGAAWAYEPEAYTFGRSASYLPDFYLPETNTWFECKGPISPGLSKAALFCKLTQQTLVVGFLRGQFLVIGDAGIENGDLFGQSVLDAIFSNDKEHMTKCMKEFSIVSLCEYERYGRYSFSNLGMDSDYGDQESDSIGGWVGFRIDHDDDPNIVRRLYFTGYSTWHQRGFAPPHFR